MGKESQQQQAEIRRPEEGERPTRQQLVKFAKQMAPELRRSDFAHLLLTCAHFVLTFY